MPSFGDSTTLATGDERSHAEGIGIMRTTQTTAADQVLGAHIGASPFAVATPI